MLVILYTLLIIGKPFIMVKHRFMRFLRLDTTLPASWAKRASSLACAGAAWVMLAASSAHAISFSDPLGTESDLPVAFAGSCGAQKVVTAVDLLSAIDIALCNNPDTTRAWAIAKSEAAALGSARSLYLPTATLDATAQRNYNDSGGGANAALGRSNNADRYNSYGPDLSLNYLLYDFGGREATVEAAKQRMLAAGWNYSTVMQTLIFQVIQAYLNVFVAQETLEAAQKTEKASREAFEAAEERLKVGVVTPADTAQAETAYAQGTLQRVKAENDLQLASGTFATLLHLPLSQSLTLKPVNPDSGDAALKTDVEALIKTGMEKRPDLAAIRADEQTAAADLAKAKSLDYPVISAYGAAGGTNYSKGAESYRSDSTIGLRLSVPLFTGFDNSYRVASARYNLQAAAALRAKTEDEAALDVWRSYHNYQTAQRTYITAQTLIKSAEASEALNMGRYKAGKGTLIDALDAQAKLADARRQWVQARYDVLITRYDLIRALGDDALSQLKRTSAN